MELNCWVNCDLNSPGVTRGREPRAEKRPMTPTLLASSKRFVHKMRA